VALLIVPLLPVAASTGVTHAAPAPMVAPAAVVAPTAPAVVVAAPAPASAASN